MSVERGDMATFRREMAEEGNRAIYDFVCEFTRMYCLAPSLDEIARGVGYSRSSVARHVEVLAARGYLIHLGCARGIVVLRRNDGYPVPDVDVLLERFG